MTPGQDLTIRPARPADLGRISEVEGVCFSTPWSPSAFRSLFQRDRVFFVVAEAPKADGGSELVGHGVLWYVEDEGELANLAVAPEARRRGVAGALLARLLAEARAEGLGSIFLEVRESNQAARALYRRWGFREVGVRKQYYERPQEDACVLRLDLERP